MVAALLVCLRTGGAGQAITPVVNPPNPSTTVEVSMAEFLTLGATHTQAFHAAVSAARERHAARLTIPPGTYRFDTITNNFQLTVDSVSDLTIDGQGAEFVFARPWYGLLVVNSQRVVIRNLTVDYEARVASLGVAQKEADGSTTILVRGDYPIDASSPVVAVNRFTHATRTWTKEGPSLYYPSAVTLIRPQTLSSPSFAPLRHGDEVIVRHHVYDGSAFYVGNAASDIAFEDIRIFSATGMGFIVFAAERGFRFSRCRIERRPVAGRLISTAADGIHIKGTRGDIIVEDSDFSLQGDDSINISGHWLTITQISGNTMTLNRAAHGQVSLGDQLTFVRRSDLSETWRARVTSLNSTSGPDYVVTMDAPRPPAVAVNDLAGNLSRNNARFLVRRNTFHDHFARGMLIQSHQGLIEDNVVRDVVMQGLHLSTDANFFFEAFGLEDVTIRRNTLSGVGHWGEIYGHGRHMGAISLVADLAGGIGAYPRHRNVVIEDNTIVDTPALGILVASADGVTVRNNTIVGANRIPFSTLRTGRDIDAEARGAIMVTRASNVTVVGNREVPASGQLDRGIYVDPRNTTGISIGGNAQEFSPVISPVGDQLTARGAAVTVPLVLDDADTPAAALTVAVTSSNAGLLPEANAVVTGAGSARQVTLTPAAGQTGATTVTVTVSDGAWHSSRSFTLTVADGIVLSTVVADTQVAFRWTPPGVAGVQGYVLEAGLAPGNTFVSLPAGSATGLDVAAPAGVYYVRVRAIIGGAAGPVSNELRLAVGAAEAPGAPTNLLASISGGFLRLAWHNAGLGGTRTTTILEAFAPGSSTLLATLPIGADAETFAVAAPPGTYALRLRAAGPTLSSPASNLVLVTIPGSCVVPAAPTGLAAQSISRSVTITWRLPDVGSTAPDSFVLEAGLTPGSPGFSIPVATRAFQTQAPAGTYYIRVRGVSVCGSSAPTPEATLTVP